MKKPSGVMRAVAVVLLVLGAVNAVAAVVTTEARRVANDPDLVVAAAGPLIHDPRFQDTITTAISTPVVDAVRENVPFSLPDLDRLVETVVEQVVASPEFVELWEQTLRTGLAELSPGLAPSENAVFTVDDGGGVQLQLQPVVAAGRQRLIDEGMPLAERIPEVQQAVSLGRSELVARLPGYLEHLDRAATVLPWTAAGLLALLLLLPGPRLRRLSSAGLLVALLVAGAVAGLRGMQGRAIGLAEGWASPATVRTGYGIATADLASALWVSAGIGVGVWILAGLLGRLASRCVNRVTLHSPG